LRGLILLLVALVGVSCARSLPFHPLVRVQLDSSFLLHAGQTAMIEGTPLRLSFVSVDEDSRCPVDVVCVWSGDAQVHLVLTYESLADEGLDLHTDLEPRSEVVHGYRVALERLEPPRQSERRIAQKQYVAAFRVTSGS
jgi:hypothetical protein